jgi:hypothetical protein
MLKIYPSEFKIRVENNKFLSYYLRKDKNDRNMFLRLKVII